MFFGWFRYFVVWVWAVFGLVGFCVVWWVWFLVVLGFVCLCWLLLVICFGFGVWVVLVVGCDLVLGGDVLALGCRFYLVVLGGFGF